jgi:hypothetical protein
LLGISLAVHAQFGPFRNTGDLLQSHSLALRELLLLVVLLLGLTTLHRVTRPAQTMLGLETSYRELQCLASSMSPSTMLHLRYQVAGLMVDPLLADLLMMAQPDHAPAVVSEG